jgi:uncharacterized repeat protein (TIGR01451 family)
MRSALIPTLLAMTLASRLPAQTTPSAPPDPAEMKRWVTALGDRHFPVRQRASERLAGAGLAALPLLQDATRSKDLEVAMRAWRIINQWAADGQVPALLFLLSDRSAPVRAAAADALGKLGASARPAVPALVDASKDPSEVVACSAREALKVIQSQPDLHLEVVEQSDSPVTVGGEVRYRIRVSNTGTASATTARVVIQLPPQITLSRVEGPNFRRDGQRVVSAPQTLDPDARLDWEVYGRATEKGAVPFTVELLADPLAQPLREVKQTVIEAGDN